MEDLIFKFIMLQNKKIGTFPISYQVISLLPIMCKAIESIGYDQTNPVFNFNVSLSSVFLFNHIMFKKDLMKLC